jgi:hypothetical protein
LPGIRLYERGSGRPGLRPDLRSKPPKTADSWRWLARNWRAVRPLVDFRPMTYLPRTIAVGEAS